MTENITLNLNSSLIDLAEACNASTRLRGGLKKATLFGQLPFESVGEYLNCGENSFERILQIDNLGVGSAYELDRIVHTFASGLSEEHELTECTNSSNADLGISIVEILESHPTSFKLSNLFKNQCVDNLPYLTLKDYVEQGQEAHLRILKFRGVGRRTANELKTIIEKYTSENCLSNSIKKASRNELAIDESIANVSIDELIRTVQCSVRLKNCILNNFENINFPFKTIRDYLNCGEGAANLILKFSNTGRKTARELNQLITGYISADQNAVGGEEQGPKYLSELIVLLMEELRPREAKIVSLRYGFYGKTELTLEEIGQDLGVTRERVRQIEKKAINKLSLETYKAQIGTLLTENKDKIYKTISDKNGVICRKTLSTAIRENLPGEHLLLINIYSGGIGYWLNTVSLETSHGWYLGPYSQECLDRCLNKIKRAIRTIALPCLSRTIMNQAQEDDELVEICLSMHDQLKVLKGVVFEKRVGPRKRRQARLYELLYNNTQPLSRLVESHNVICPEEKCSYRDAHIVMSEAPQLFIPLGDEEWATVGHLEQRDLTEHKTPQSNIDIYEDDLNEEDSEENGTQNLVGFVRQLLKETGPIHFVELRDRFLARSNNKYSPSSLGPIMFCNDGFIRLAPGIYGLTDSAGKIDPAFLRTDAMMQSSDCYIYVISRWAGEPVNSFPLWSYELEYDWCKWAQNNVSDELFSSLLAICTPGLWQTTDDEKTFWANLKAKKGSYRLDGESRHSLYDKLPSLRELYCVLNAIEQLHDLNWIRINRVLGKRLNDNHSASFLSILIALGVIEPATSWQRPHSIDAHGAYLREELGKALTLHGTLSWGSKLGQSLIAKLQEAINARDMGWVDKSEFDQLTSELFEDAQRRGDAKAEETLVPLDNNETTLEVILNEHENRKKDDDFSSIIESLL